MTRPRNRNRRASQMNRFTFYRDTLLIDREYYICAAATPPSSISDMEPLIRAGGPRRDGRGGATGFIAIPGVAGYYISRPIEMENSLGITRSLPHDLGFTQSGLFKRALFTARLTGRSEASRRTLFTRSRYPPLEMSLAVSLSLSRLV